MSREKVLYFLHSVKSIPLRPPEGILGELGLKLVFIVPKIDLPEQKQIENSHVLSPSFKSRSKGLDVNDCFTD